MPEVAAAATHSGVGTLCGFTHHLHDEVALRLKTHTHTHPSAQCVHMSNVCVCVCLLPDLLVEVGLGELQGVEQGVGGGQLDVVAGLLLPHALDDGCQDLVTVLLKLLRVLRQQGGGRGEQGVMSHQGHALTTWTTQFITLQLQSQRSDFQPSDFLTRDISIKKTSVDAETPIRWLREKCHLTGVNASDASNGGPDLPTTTCLGRCLSFKYTWVNLPYEQSDSHHETISSFGQGAKKVIGRKLMQPQQPAVED